MSSRKKREIARKKAEQRSAYAAQQRYDSKLSLEKKEEKLTKVFKSVSNDTKIVTDKILYVVLRTTPSDFIEREQNQLNIIIEYIRHKIYKLFTDIKLLKFNNEDLNTYHINMIVFLSKSSWIRDIKFWKPKGKCSDTKLESLVHYLVGKYPIPNFLFNIFYDKQDTEKYSKLFLYLIQGGGMKSARKNGLIDIEFTQKMDYLFLRSHKSLKLVEAVRHAQILSFGGSVRLAKFISARLSSLKNEKYWSTIIQWLCNQSIAMMFDYAQISPMIDWFETKITDKNFVLKGRTINSVLKEVDAWHKELNTQKVFDDKAVYPPSGFSEILVDDPDNYWGIKEILDGQNLLKEGKTMHHCVYSYSGSIKKGIVSIWSLRIFGERTLTIELNNKERKITQVRGKFNKPADKSQLYKIGIWARKNNLEISRHL
jgi:hypothetical protein